MHLDPQNFSLTRRRFLQASAVAAAAGALATTAGTSFAGAAPRGTVPLPSAQQIRTDYQTMVDFGPRLCGSDAHNRFTDWIEQEFRAAGLTISDCDDSYAYTTWQAERFALDVLDGPITGPVPIATAFVRSASTGAAGVTGPLVYGGQLPPLPAINPGDLAATAAGLAGYPEQLASWAAALPGRIGGVKDSILVVDALAGLPITALPFVAIQTHLQWAGHSLLDWGVIDYKRAWLGPWPHLSTFAAMGVKAVVVVADASFDLLEGNFSPHQSEDASVPGLVVDRETGNDLRRRAGNRPLTRLILETSSHESTVRSVTGVLPGTSDEVAIVDSHTDGQNVFEENGAVAVVQLARHFASLPPGERLSRTLVFAAWPGHMSPNLPEVDGWMDTHRDLTERATTAITIEHLGATEWIDTVDNGYHPTGQNEIYGIWTTQGPMFEQAREALIEANIDRHALLRPPIEITPGYAFHEHGIPHVAGISGPTYLLKVTPDDGMDKLDADLAARQTAFYADVLRRVDAIAAADLSGNDPTLGTSDNPFPSKKGPFEPPISRCE